MSENRPPHRLIMLSLLILPVLALLLALGPIGAAPADVAAPDDWQIVAEGLANPRGITFGPDGALYVAEAGSGGEGACVPGPEGGNVCYGDSSAITRVTLDETRAATAQERVITGLPSLGDEGTGDAATGAHAVAFDSAGDMYLITGFGADPALRDPAGPFGADGMNFAHLMTADPVAGTFAPWVDLGAYEAIENPDGGPVDTNPFDLLAMGDDFAVIDAGGNNLLSVDGGTGDISNIAVFPSQDVEFPPGTGSTIPSESVPTAVRVGPDGALYVGELTGFPFPAGGASVWRVEPGEDPEVYAAGFSAILDIDFAIDGSLYVLEMFTNGQLSGDPTGAIIRIAPDGHRTEVARDGLIAPTGMTIGPDHALYVSNIGVSAIAGHVVRIPTVLSEATEFVAFLNGDNEVPPVDTDAWGMAQFSLDELTLAYEVHVYNISDITAAHIHIGAPGENGPPIFPLYDGTGPFDPDNPIMGEVQLTPEDVDDLKAGLYYVNVHTTGHPAGEIRGQIGVALPSVYLPVIVP
jgi:hypothetical protein